MLLPVSVLSLFFQQPLRNLSVHISCLVVGMESQDASHRKADENYSFFLADLAKLCLTSPLVEQYKSVLSIDHIIVQLVHFCCQVWRMRGLTAILVAHKKQETVTCKFGFTERDEEDDAHENLPGQAIQRRWRFIKRIFKHHVSVLNWKYFETCLFSHLI